MKSTKDIMYTKAQEDEKQVYLPHRTKMPNDSSDDQPSPVKKFDHGKNPSSLANLKKWKPGESGNPGGRPTKYKKLADALLPYAQKRATKHEWDENLKEYVNIESDDTFREEVLQMIWQRARNGDIKYVELLARLGCLDEK